MTGLGRKLSALFTSILPLRCPGGLTNGSARSCTSPDAERVRPQNANRPSVPNAPSKTGVPAQNRGSVYRYCFSWSRFQPRWFSANNHGADDGNEAPVGSAIKLSRHVVNCLEKQLTA